MRFRVHFPTLFLATSLTLAAWFVSAAHAATGWTLIGWNNLGMHCTDADFSVFSLLPPFSTIQAQLIDPQGHLVTDPAGLTVTYEAVADPDGSINTSSQGKLNFWEHAQDLFGLSQPLPVDAGLAGSNMPGPSNQPQPMAFDAQSSWFIAEGIPLTPYDDAGHKNYYPLMRLVARDGSEVLATTDIVLPVSDEMDCSSCHASNSSGAARPAQGWVNDPDAQRDMRLNILRLHDERESSRPSFQDALVTAGYNPAGLYATAATDGTAILCARCHASEALPGSGIAGISPLTQAIHRRMANVVDPVTGLTLDSTGNRSACYRCHPGSVTRCLRGAMGNAVAADGTLAMQCQSCHGSMSEVASVDRTGWLDEPACQNCHTGTAVLNNGEIRYTSAFEPSGDRRAAVDQTFATNADKPAPGYSLYRFSTGHGGLQCEACHGSTHAEFPSSHRNDNLQSIALQGHVGMLIECTGCHASDPDTIDGGPHGVHPVGQVWVERHGEAVGEGQTAACRACHGADYRGTVLSRAQADRTLSSENFGTKHLWRGFQVSCYTCHLGPNDSNPNPNQPPSASDAAITTVVGAPAATVLVATDPNADTLQLRIVSQPSHGTVSLDGANATYFPEAGFVGEDQFTFAAWDGSTDSNLAAVAVQVNDATPTPTPTPTRTITAKLGTEPCVGDCNNDSTVTIDELVLGVDITLGRQPLTACAGFDVSGDKTVTVDELARAVNSALSGCVAVGTPTPTPTFNPNATFANIQTMIFDTTCRDANCHTGPFPQNNLSLDPGVAYDQLVNKAPVNFFAAQDGLLRVDPGHPDNSLLLIKLTTAPPQYGAPMPSGKPPLSAEQIQLIRAWITQGALP